MDPSYIGWATLLSNHGTRLHFWAWDATDHAATACGRWRMTIRQISPLPVPPWKLDTIPPCPACVRARQRAKAVSV